MNLNILNIVVSGVLVFIIGEIFVRFFLGPIHNLKETKGEIARILIFHANNFGKGYAKVESAFDNDKTNNEIVSVARVDGIQDWNDDLTNAADDTRDIAAKLIEKAEAIPFYNIVALLKLVPPKTDILNAKKQLIGISNSFDGQSELKCAERSDKICKLLKIQFVDE